VTCSDESLPVRDALISKSKTNQVLGRARGTELVRVSASSLNLS
jgi:hypothetical protein